MLSLNKQVFIVLLSFSNFLVCVAKVSEETNCLFLNDEMYMITPALLNAFELERYLFMIRLDK